VLNLNQVTERKSLRPLILLVNDDGILSPGLHAVAEAVYDLGDLVIAAPRFQQTSMGRAMPNGPTIGIIEQLEITVRGRPHVAYGIHGAPAQAVQHGVLELTPRKPDLCISGINYGENLGFGLTISGTIGAALEASSMGIPSLAVSSEIDVSMHNSAEYGIVNWDMAAHFTRHFAEKMLKCGLHSEVSALNVNVPDTATLETPIRWTIQSRQNYFASYLKTSPRDFSQGHRLSYRMSVDWDTLEPDSDIHAFIKDRVVSVTPLGWRMISQMPLEAWYKEFDS